MGQNSSQPQGEEINDPVDGTGREIQSDHGEGDDHSPGDAPLFSSQLDSTINPSFQLSRRPNNTDFSSSPVSRLRSPQASTPHPSRNMVDSAPFLQPSPGLPSWLDQDEPTNEHESPHRRSKKKKRDKKRLSATSQPTEDQPPVDFDALDEIEQQQQHGANGEDADKLDNTVAGSPQQTLTRSQQRKERRRSKRAAKLAKLQEVDDATIEVNEQPNDPVEEPSIVVKHDEEGGENQPDETVESVPKKKKRKRKSRARVEEGLQSPKRHKQFHNESSDDALPETPDEDVHKNAVDNTESAHVPSGHKQNSHPNGILRESTPDSDAEPEHEATMEPMDDDMQVENDLEPEYEAVEEPMEDDLQVESEAASDPEAAEEPMEDNIQVETEADDVVEESYQDDDIDLDYNDDNGETSAASGSPSASRVITRRTSSASSKGPNTLSSLRNDALVTTGVVPAEMGDSEEQDDAGADEGIASNDMDNTIENIEVPSTLPYSSSANGPSTQQPGSAKTRSGRKRVAKPDFFSRMADDNEEIANSQSPSKASSLKRKTDRDTADTGKTDKRTKDKGKKDKGDKTTPSKDKVQASSSATDRKSRRRKKTTVAKNGANTDNNGEEDASPEIAAPSPAELTGAFTELEITNLTQAINQFRDEKELTQPQVNELIHGNPKAPEISDLWERIIETCPGRSRQRLINQTRRRFHNFEVRGSWTPEQHEELRQLYERYGNKYTLIGQLMNRYSEDVRDRARNYIVCGDNLKKDQWDQEETDRLIAIVEEAITEINHQRVKQGLDESRPVEEDINWELVSQGMNRTRSRLQCISRWKVIKPRLVGSGLDGMVAPINEMIEQAREIATTISHRNRSLIIKGILKSGANAESRIPWLRIRIDLGSQWSRPPIMVVWTRLKLSIPNWKDLSVPEICTTLLKGYKKTHELEFSDDIDETVEYRELENKLKRGRKSKSAPKSAAFVFSDDEEEEEQEGEKEANGDEQEEPEEGQEGEEEEQPEEDDEASEQLGATGDEAADDSGSVDLGVGSAGDKDEIEDSEPETDKRRLRLSGTRSGGRRSKAQLPLTRDSDEESSDTNASQVASIPAV